MEGRGDGGLSGGGDGGDGGSGEERVLKRKGGEIDGNFDEPTHQTRVVFPSSLRYFSSKCGDAITFDEYVENMKPDQKDIYYIAADSVTSARNTPSLEKLAEKDIEVLIIVNPTVDDMRMRIEEDLILDMKSYKGKNFVYIGDKEDEDRLKQEFGGICDWIKKCLGERVDIVRVSNNLKTTSPCVIDNSGKVYCSLKLERLRKGQNADDIPLCMSAFEINPEHPLIISLHETCKSNPTDEVALRLIDLLYKTAKICNGDLPKRPAEYGEMVYEMICMTLLGRWGSSPSAAHTEQQAHTVSSPDTDEAEAC